MMTWVIFAAAIAALLALDLGVFNKDPHRISAKEAGRWTAVWASLALFMTPLIWWLYREGAVANPNDLSPIDASLKYLTGYLLEITLSMDNLFVIAVIFRSMRTPAEFQHRVLFWGIIGAVIMRVSMVLVGVSLIKEFEFMTYLFGAFLIYTAFTMLKDDHDEAGAGGWVKRLLGRIVPITNEIEGRSFMVRKNGVLHATPLFVALLMVEFTDVLFALDSIPAVLAVTTDPFLVLTSNVMAILGLRSMYFFLADMMDRFHLLKYAIMVLLVYVGLKMLLASVIHPPEWFSFAFILVTLGVGVWVSMRAAK